MNKRTILIIVIVIGSILLTGPLGLSPAFLIAGVVLAFIIGGKGDQAAAQVIQQGRVTVTEIREKMRRSEPIPPPPAPSEPFRPGGDRTRPDAPTVALRPKDEVITGHLVLDPTEVLPPDEPEPAVIEPDFLIGTTEDGKDITLKRITSMGVGGVPGSGKTVAMVGLSTQAVVKYKGNIRIVVVDPHMYTGSDEALSSRMSPLAPFYLNVQNLPNPVSGGDDLLKWMRWLTQEAKDRKAGKGGKVNILLVVDEFTDLMDDEEMSGPLTELIRLINEQARKMGIFALVASPAWKSSRVQGTDIRNTLSAFLVHHMTPNIARQLLPYEEAEKANRLEVGQAIFSSFGKVETVRVPYLSAKDIARCIQPYLPVKTEKPLSDQAIPVSGELVLPDQDDPLPDPGIAEVKAIWETYQILDEGLRYDEDNIIRALAIDFYPGDPRGQEKVRRALKLGEEHL